MRKPRITHVRNFPAEAAEIRRLVGLTQAELAEMIDVDATTLSRWERGQSHPGPWKGARWHYTIRDLQHNHTTFEESPPDLPGWARFPKEIVYVAAPLVIDRPTIDAALRAIEARYRGARIVDGTTQFRDNDDWRRVWKWMLRSIDYLVVVPAADGTVGTGVFKEVNDARAHGVLVEFLIDGTAVSWREVDLVKLDDFTPARAYAVVRREVA
jgi:transcriptional regulator with XRE-family HTH domain